MELRSAAFSYAGTLDVHLHIDLIHLLKPAVVKTHPKHKKSKARKSRNSKIQNFKDSIAHSLNSRILFFSNCRVCDFLCFLHFGSRVASPTLPTTVSSEEL